MTTNRRTTNHRTARMTISYRALDSKITQESARVARERSLIDAVNPRCRTILQDPSATKADPADGYTGAKTCHRTPNAR